MSASCRLSPVACRLSFAMVAFGTMSFVGIYDANATQVAQHPLPEVIENSAFIGLVRVPKVSPDLMVSNAGHGLAETTLVVLDTIESAHGLPQFDLYLPIGRSEDDPDSIEYTVEAPLFLEGSDYIVFLARGGWDSTPVANWWFSIFEVVDLGGKPLWLMQDGHCVAGVTEDGYVAGPRIEIDTFTRFLSAEYDEELVEVSDSLGMSEQGATLGCADGDALLIHLRNRVNQHYVQRPRGQQRPQTTFWNMPWADANQGPIYTSSDLLEVEQ